MLITKEPEVAQFAWENGVERIFVDLEIHGKEQRQGHLSTVISRHSFDDITTIRQAVPEASLLVRLNPLWRGTPDEIDRAIGLGADILMQPMFHSADEVAEFGKLVARRVRFIPLIETEAAIRDAAAIVANSDVDEIFIGLNDLHLDMKLPFMFTPLANGVVDGVATVAKGSGKPFGFGGVARVGEGDLPGELVIAEHVRLGSSSVILSRTFMRDFDPRNEVSRADLLRHLGNLRVEEERLATRSYEEQQRDRLVIQARVTAISERRVERSV